MDFFEAQTRARQRTGRLVLLFALAVAGTVIALYAAAVFFFASADSGLAVDFGDGTGWWRPRLFAAIATGTLAVIGFASLFKWLQYSQGGRVVAESVGARRVDPRTSDFHEKRLLNVVEEMAIASGTPVPAVYVLDDEPAINAFAAGLTSNDAVVAVTRGTLEKLNRDELQGVVGHEFSHILNGDMRLNVRIGSLLFGILVLGLIGRGLLSSLRHVRPAPSSRDRRNGGGLIAALGLIGVILLVVGYIGWFFGRIIQAAVSRQREFLADAAAVQFTRNPAGIAGALKKIGGYALGSSLQSSKSAEIGHFFFAQGFRSSFGGLWATHPPLPARIRAIDPHFDGRFHEPPQVVDISLESFVSAGFVAPRGPGSVRAPQPAAPPPLAPAAAFAAVAAVGTLSAAQIEHAHTLLENLPPSLREAAHDPVRAPALVCGLLVDPGAPEAPARLRLVTERAGADTAAALTALLPDFGAVGPAQRLPLLQLALPALRGLPPAALDTFLGTLDELVHADERVTTFEFALQRLLVHSLRLGRTPATTFAHYHSFAGVAEEIAVVLSALAHATTADPAFAPAAFAAGRAHLALIASRLQLQPPGAADFSALDRALDKIALASPPIKQRTLVAAAAVVGADGRLLVTEAELLRAIAAALDCPMPPLGSLAGNGSIRNA